MEPKIVKILAISSEGNLLLRMITLDIKDISKRNQTVASSMSEQIQMILYCKSEKDELPAENRV